MKNYTLLSVLENSTEKFANNPALSWVDDEPMTFSQANEKIQQLKVLLNKQGIISEDRVAILSENMPNWAIAYFAVTSMGAVAVPILPDFHPNEIHHILRHSESKAIFVSEKLYEKLEEEEFEKLNSIILMDDFSLIPPRTKRDALRDVVKERTKEFAKLKAAALKMAGLRNDEIKEDDLAAIIYTSGTTGKSKGVMLTHKNIVYDAYATTLIVKVAHNDRLLSVLPLSHTYECTLGLVIPFMQGSCVYYMNKPPIARVLLPAMQKIRPTMMLTVPLIIEKIYKLRILPQLTKSTLLKQLTKIEPVRKKIIKLAGKKLLKSFGGELHFFGIGGSAVSPEVEKFMREAKFPYAIGYGLTETSPLIAGTDPTKTRYRSTGPALPGVQVKIDKPDPKTGEGEILVKGPSVMRGYYNDDEQTKSVFTEDGWFRTGDLGVLDENDYLYIKGRLKNMILGPSGENIYPEQIEYIINENDSVLESLVYQQENKLVARVFLNYEELDKEFSAQKLTETQIHNEIKTILENIRTDVNNRVSTFSRISKIIEQTEPFEKTPTQKVKRYLYA